MRWAIPYDVSLAGRSIMTSIDVIADTFEEAASLGILAAAAFHDVECGDIEINRGGCVMLSGFPKNVTKEKLGRGHYRLTRDDGYTVEVRQGVGGWWFGSRKIKSLGVAEFDMRNGYTAHDQLRSV